MIGSISIIIPAYNEEERLPSTLERILDYLRGRGFAFAEIIVVDDGSRDRTAELARGFASRHPLVRVLGDGVNRGKGYAVRQGMLAARGEWALFTDADLSAPIEELDRLIEAVNRSLADVAIGSRALDRSLIGARQSRIRENAGRLFNLMARVLTGLPFWDTQCGFKLFSRRAREAVFPRQKLNGFGFDVEALFLAKRAGLRTVEEPVRWNHSEGTKVRMGADSLRMGIDLLQIRWRAWRGKYK